MEPRWVTLIWSSESHLRGFVPFSSWSAQLQLKINFKTEFQKPLPNWPKLISRSGSWLEIKKVWSQKRGGSSGQPLPCLATVAVSSVLSLPQKQLRTSDIPVPSWQMTCTFTMEKTSSELMNVIFISSWWGYNISQQQSNKSSARPQTFWDYTHKCVNDTQLCIYITSFLLHLQWETEYSSDSQENRASGDSCRQKETRRAVL